jgi:hypothetical protein
MKKEISIQPKNKYPFGGFYRLLPVLLVFLLPVFSFAQTDTTKASEAASQEVVTYSPLIEFISIQKNDNSVDLKASMKAKIKGTLTQLPGFKIEFFVGPDTAAKKAGEAATDRNGVAIFNCKPDQLVIDGEGKLNFKAVFAGKGSLEPAEELLSVKRARLEITPVKEDSVLSLNFKLVDLSTGTETPVPETDVVVFVKRLFSGLKLGEGKTNENGETQIEIANNLPGDAKGNITLIGKIEENELYGNLEATVKQPWGTPVSDKLQELPRALWSTHPPIWMLVTFIVLMTVVWGHYLVIIFELFRLRKEEPKSETSN